MDKKRVALQRQRKDVVRMVYVLQDIAWAAAWPRLDDWFKPEVYFIGPGRRRLGIA